MMAARVGPYFNDVQMVTEGKWDTLVSLITWLMDVALLEYFFPRKSG